MTDLGKVGLGKRKRQGEMGGRERGGRSGSRVCRTWDVMAVVLIIK